MNAAAARKNRQPHRQITLWSHLADCLEAEERSRESRRRSPVCPRCGGLRIPDHYDPDILTCTSCGRHNRPRVNPGDIEPEIPENSDAYYQHVIKPARKRERLAAGQGRTP